MRYQGWLPKSHRTSSLASRDGAATKWPWNSVGAMVDSKHDGQILKAFSGQPGRVNQSL
jgi:hypothetical protein